VRPSVAAICDRPLLPGGKTGGHRPPWCEVTSQGIFAFPPFRLDAANQQLWRGSQLLTMRPKTFEVLLYLVQNAQRLRLAQFSNVTTDQYAADDCVRPDVLEQFLLAYLEWHSCSVRCQSALVRRVAENFS